MAKVFVSLAVNPKSREAHQLPDPTIVTLCFCSCPPSVAMALAETVCSWVEGERSVAETQARRRRADFVTAMLTTKQWSDVGTGLLW